MESLQTPLMTATMVGYTIALLLYVAKFVFAKDYFKKAARLVIILGFALNSALLGIRTILVGTLPLSNMFEFGLFFVWGIALIIIIVDFKYDMWALGMFALPVSIVLLIWLFTLDTTVRPVMPALRSNWIFIHVLTAVLAYGAFGVSFALSIMYLLKDMYLNKGKNNRLLKALPSLEIIDDVSYKIIFVGMPFLTIMIITGAIWAEYAWGTYWSWDPKETWALITWFIYAIYLHVRLMRGWKGKGTAILSIIGFVAVLFTLIGVTYLLPGAHSYA